MATYTQWLATQLGAGNTGQAANLRCTVTDSGGTVRINALNAPDGTNAFAEDTDAAGNAVTGSYAARATNFDTTWPLPLRVKFTVVGVASLCAVTTFGGERAAEVADGYTAALTTLLAATNTRVVLALPAVAPGAAGGLPTGNAANKVAATMAIGDNADKANFNLAATQSFNNTGQTAKLPTIDDLCSIADSVQAAPAPAVGAFAGSSGLLSTDGAYLNMTLVFTSGALKGLAHKVTGYTGSTRLLAFANAFPSAPSAADTFILVGRTE